MEKLLMECNKWQLQQIAMERTLPSTEPMKEAIELNGTDGMGDMILRSEVTTELDQFPHVILIWLQQFARNEMERKQCIPIDGFIHQFEFQHAFKDVKE